MARTLNPAAHTVRREAFMDAAQRLIQAKGYEQMSIQDVLDECEASRGAFYHYFDSKQALLEAVVERLAEGVMVQLAPILDDPALPADRKLERVLAGIARWKSQRKDLALAILQVWLSDDNAIVRDKLRRLSARLLTPLYSRIVRQGVAEGLFAARDPDETALVAVSLQQAFSEVATRMFVDRHAGLISFEAVRRSVDAYTEAFERVLGAAPGSLTLTDESTLREWFD